MHNWTNKPTFDHDTNVYLDIRITLYIIAFFTAGDLLSQSIPLRLVYDNPAYVSDDDTLIQNKNKQTPEVLLYDIIESMINNNYLEASLDSVVLDTATVQYKAHIHTGRQYDFTQLTLDSLSIQFVEKLKLKKPTNTLEYLQLRQSIIDYYGNSGYPFCKIYLDGLEFQDTTLLGQLQIDLGKQITIDSIHIVGDLKIRQAYIENYLGLKDDVIYNQEQVLGVRSQLDKLTFLKQVKPPDLSFFLDQASMNLYLEPKNASRFDLLFGVIPTTNIQGQQLFLSLDFTAELLNKLGYGEYIFINFERLRPEQQQLQLEFNYPYLLDLPFGIDTKLSLFRNALNYSTLQADLGIQYLMNSTDYLKVSWNYESSDIIEVDTTTIRNSKMLPIDLDYSQTGLGLELYINRLDYKFNPKSGYQIKIKGVAGEKSIRINPQITQIMGSDGFDYGSLYDSLDLKSPRFEIRLDGDYYLPLAARSAIGFHLKGGWRYSAEGLLRNEKYQIGGNQILRGFDEAAFFTSYYAVSTIDYRLLLSNNSYFSVPFVDIGYFELENGNSTVGVGVGGSLGFETKVGLFNFSVAVGRTSEIAFDLGRPKAHFGFISLF